MWMKIFFLCVAVVLRRSEGACLSYFEDDCDGTVICVTNAGRVDYMPHCYSATSHLEFVVKESKKTFLEAYFFGSTNFDVKVTKFTAIGNSWRNLGRDVFKYYVNCKVMDLSNNEIFSIDDGAFNGLKQLTHLNISHNVIEQLTSDFLFVSSDYYNDIQVIDLSYNSLTELQSPIFKEAPKLIYISLSNNKLITLDQIVFTGIRDLKELYLSNNSLTSPTFLSELIIDYANGLNTLDMSFNRLNVVLKDEMHKLAALTNLNMSHNQIELVDSDSFSHAHYLEVIDLSNNNIKSDITNTLFIANDKLKYLDLSNNSIKTIQRKSFQFNHLQYLNLDKNLLTGDIMDGTFVGLNQITSFNLCNQNLTGLKSNAFQDWTQLYRLNLSGNQLSTIESGSFNNTNALQYLDLSHNKITEVAFFKNCLSNLTELDLSNNILTVIPSRAFVNQTLLIKLDLTQNNIFSIEQNALPLNGLEYLFLTGNRLNGTIRKYTFSPAKFLRRLDLSNSFIEKIENESLSDMPVLTRLDLSMNQIEFIGSNNFYGMNNMYSLNISYNKLSQLELNESNIFNLNGLHLRNNNLTSIKFYNMSQLTFLDLSQNNISDVSIQMLDNFPKIKALLLSHNNISNFNSDVTNTLSTLTTLDLSNNNISTINLTYFEKLEDVNLSYNQLQCVDHYFFKNHGQLLWFDISNNQISDIAPGSFQFVASLRTLNLSSNTLTYLRYGVFNGLSNIEVLDLSKNYISNFEVDIFHECPNLQYLILDYNNLSHIDVARLAKIAPVLHKLSIGGNRLPCRDIVNLIKNTDQTLYRFVNITSIDILYHDDNVKGIKCGAGVNKKENSTNSKTVKPEDAVETSSDIGIVVTWCLFLTVLFVSIGVFAYLYLYKRRKVRYEPNNEIFMNVDQQHDLLT